MLFPVYSFCVVFTAFVVSLMLRCTLSMVCWMIYVMSFSLNGICYGFSGISYGPTCNIIYVLSYLLWDHLGEKKEKKRKILPY